MKASLKSGCNFWNGGELYGKPNANSLHLLNRYFTKYPEDADKVIISIKGGLVPGEMRPDGSAKNVRRSIGMLTYQVDDSQLYQQSGCNVMPACHRGILMVIDQRQKD